MREIAFATCPKFPEITDHDQLTADILRQRGIQVASAVWNAPGIDWSRFECVVIRSTWEYDVEPHHYERWLQRFTDGPRLWNPPEAVIWNINKKYLLSLTERGVEVAPMMYVHSGEAPALRALLVERQWSAAVIKPAVSGNARGTWRTSLTSADQDQAQFAEQLRHEDLLIQPYMPEIASQGEWSLIFFADEYSHAVLKRPAAGDFRVQRDFGGTTVLATPPQTFVEQAREVLAAADFDLLYARVDAIERQGKLILMELEINEPFLFLGYCEQSAERFASAIERVLR